MRQALERLLNLLAFLLTAGRPVTADEIRYTVAGYDRGSTEAFHRMFERDKELLRGLGVPLERRPTDAWEVEFGYAVPPENYRLPDPGLTDEERTALWLAAQVVRLGGQPSGPEALFKLGGGTSDWRGKGAKGGSGGGMMSGAGEPLAADLGPPSAVLAEAFRAVSERRVVSFRYRDQARTVAPYGLVHQRGHWYLVGAQRGGVRAYRVDRIAKFTLGEQPAAFEKPADFRLRQAVPSTPWEAGEQAVQARVEFSPEVAWWAERQLSPEASIRRIKSGGISVKMPVANPDAFVGWIIGFGDGAVVTAPSSLREKVVDRVKGVA